MKATVLAKKLIELIPVMGDFDVTPSRMSKISNGATSPTAAPKNPKVLFEIPRGEILDVKTMLKILGEHGLLEVSDDGTQFESIRAFHVILGEGK
jgi:hypothetical protein